MNPNEQSSLAKNLSIGFIIGATEAYVNHPLWTLKTRIQQGKSFTFNPQILYRGVHAHAMSSIPLDTLQTAASRIFLESVYFEHLSEAPRRLVAGLLGGCLGTLISSPAEMVMTRQQDANVNFREASIQLWREGRMRKLFTGFSGTLGRDSSFCCGFFAGVPILRQELQNRSFESIGASITAGIVAGSITAVVSQPFDTLKTIAQSSPKRLSIFTIAYHLYKKQGLRGFFTGLTFRIGRVTSAVFILGTLNDKLEEVILGKQYHKE